MIVDLIIQQMINQKKVLGYEVNSSFKIPSNKGTLNAEDASHTEGTIKKLEQSEQISEFDLFILTNVVARIKSDLSKGIPVNKLSINISAKTLPYVDDVCSIIKDVAQYLILEITETANINIDVAKNFVSKVRSLGAKIALDDLNHSSQGLVLVKELMPDISKFVYPQENSNFNYFINFILDAASLKSDMDIVIENIEKEHDLLSTQKEFPDAYIQGYYIDKGSVYLEELRFKI